MMYLIDFQKVSMTYILISDEICVINYICGSHLKIVKYIKILLLMDLKMLQNCSMINSN